MPRIYVVSHTHWDREWYEPFQVFRTRLVRCIDKLLDLMSGDPEYRHFLLDGQTIVLEDYLEVRPERIEALRELANAHKLDIGPWYVLPDEFLVSGESILRNLARGSQMAEKFGGIMHLGYVPDPFGHISQMPQILRGVGIRTAVFRRGLADEPTELWWQGSDGTRVLVCYLRDGYGNLADAPRDEAGFVHALEGVCASLTPHAVTANLLAMNGTDHMDPWQEIPHLIRVARKWLDMEIEHSSLPMYVEQVEQEISENKLQLETAKGELRNPKRHHLLPGVASMRMWIKQRNARCQMLLEKWAEPFLAFALPSQPRVTNDSNRALLQVAWKYLLQNHPHDSICGCSVDATHADMAPRFDWVEQIAGGIAQESLDALAAMVDTHVKDAAGALVVFNPVAGPRTDIVIASVHAPSALESLSLTDDQGNPVPCQIREKRSEGASNLFTIEFVARDVPGYGYRTFHFHSSAASPKVTPSPHPLVENEFFRIEPNPLDGTLVLTDKTTGIIYRNLNCFVDSGDRGDVYNHCPPEQDLSVVQPSAPPDVRIESGAVRHSISIDMIYRLPEQLAQNRAARRTEMVDEQIRVTVSLYPGVRRVDFRVQVENRARDHRLGVEFPTPIVTAHASTEQAFDVVDRPLALPADTADWVEQPRPEAPMQGFASVSDNKVGLTLATRGLPEYEVRPDEQGVTLALTLLRCVGWLSRGDLATRSGHAGPMMETPGAQEIGSHTFEYTLIPHSGDWRNATLDAHHFVAPMRAVATSVHHGALPSSASFVTVSPNEFVITAIKLPDKGEGLIVRGYNIVEEPTEVHLDFRRNFARATRANILEEPGAPISLDDSNTVRFCARRREIVTLRLE